MTWSTERKAKQSQAIRQWQPWTKSTGARTSQGKDVVSRNAFKGGHRPHLRQLAKDLAQECQHTQQLVRACLNAYVIT
jgi:hypothetical protein